MTDRRNLGWLRVVLAVCMLQAGGCASGDTFMGTTGQTEAAAASGDWTLVLLSEEGAVFKFSPGQVTLTLDGAEGWGFAGCNDYRFESVTSAGRITLDGGVATTKRLCRELGVLEREDRYLRMLSSVTAFEQTDEKLLLSGGTGRLEYIPNR